ncbi:MAG TPA: phosphoribosylglycinamide formyltransferase 2, partial [Anaeromyxobacteraceae bacterium]|nr:phosphoribosylglycinamide formyltransferase 2 [Anaeromyxobacteraceae bacterium]
IPEMTLVRPGASAVILAGDEGPPRVRGLEAALGEPGVDVRIFGKPVKRPHRRMGVALVAGQPGDDPRALVERAKAVAAKVSV